MRVDQMPLEKLINLSMVSQDLPIIDWYKHENQVLILEPENSNEKAPWTIR